MPPEEGGGASPEVAIKLVVDDQSQATLAKVRDGLHGVHEDAHKASESTKGMGEAAEKMVGGYLAGAAAVAAVGAALYEAYEFAKMLGEAAIEAADDAVKQEKAMAGTLMLISGGKEKMGDLQRYTAGVREELEQTAIQAGVATKEMGDAFTTLVSRGTMGSEKAKELTQQMALVGKIVPQGMSGLAEGFAMMELGVARARNPIVQLVAATGTLKGNARQVAQEMQKMTPEKMLEIGEKAISKQAEMMKKTGGLAHLETLGSLKTSFEGLREAFFTSMGKPMLDAIIPPLTRVKAFLSQHLEEIQVFGEKVGLYFGQAIDVMSGIFGGVYEAFTQNWETVETTAKEAAAPFKDAWTYVFDHQAEIVSTFKSVTKDVIDAAKWLIDFLGKIIEAQESITRTLAHFASFGAVKSVAGKEAEGGEAAMRGAVHGSNKDFENAVNSYRHLADAADTPIEEVNDLVRTLTAFHNQAMQTNQAVKAAAEEGNIGELARYFNRAVQTHQKGDIEYALTVLEGSEEARKALLVGADKLEGGIDSVIKAAMLGDHEKLAKELREQANTVALKGGIGAPQNIHNWNGGQTFNLKQDFRDQDPDRVAIVFRRDVLRAAESRRQARTTTPFGL